MKGRAVGTDRAILDASKAFLLYAVIKVEMFVEWKG